MLVTIHYQGKKEVILFDAGTTDDGALHNMDVLEVKPKDLHAVVLSHGHSDHTLGLIGLLKRFGRHGMPIILHRMPFSKEKTCSLTVTKWIFLHPTGEILRQRESMLSKNEVRLCSSTVAF